MGLMRLADGNFCPWRLGRNAEDFLSPTDRLTGRPVCPVRALDFWGGGSPKGADRLRRLKRVVLCVSLVLLGMQGCVDCEAARLGAESRRSLPPLLELMMSSSFPR